MNKCVCVCACVCVCVGGGGVCSVDEDVDGGDESARALEKDLVGVVWVHCVGCMCTNECVCVCECV